MAITRIRGRQLQRRRELFRDANPWCVDCLEDGIYTPWDELDHIVALEQGGADTDENLQGLCAAHHDAKTARDRGYTRRSPCDEHGNPLDSNHPWNQKHG